MALRDVIWSPPVDAQQVAFSAPTIVQLNAAIGRSERFLDSLYKGQSDGTAVQSETYGLPFRVYFVGSKEWVLIGENGQSSQTAYADFNTSSADSERYRYTFTNSRGSTFQFDAEALWGPRYRLTINPIAVDTEVQVWIDSKQLGTFTPDNSAPLTRTTTDSSLFRSLRYTVRHATQEAYFYYLARGNHARANALAAFLERNGYEAGLDVRAVMFGDSRMSPENLPFDKTAYSDCTRVPVASSVAYPYISKICASLDAYLVISARDPLLQTYEALLVSQSGGPQQEYPAPPLARYWLGSSTPVETARQLESQWWRTGNGIPACTPISCNGSPSAIRTSAFGLLETILGYQHGDNTSRRYADAAASALLSAQVPENGSIRLAKKTLHRPIAAGSFLISWSRDGSFADEANGASLAADAEKLVGLRTMLPEYLGLQVSNSETSFDAWAFLVRYRCERFGMGCGPRVTR